MAGQREIADLSKYIKIVAFHQNRVREVHSAPSVWNTLPKSITNCDTLPVFKAKQSKAEQSKRSLDEGAGRSLYALQIK